MGYKFHNQCYDTLFDFHLAFAQECFKVSGAGLGAQMLSCTADTGGYVVMQSYQLSNGTYGTPWNYTPQAVTCDYLPPPTMSDSIELAWLIVGVWVVAWGFKKMMEAIKK